MKKKVQLDQGLRDALRDIEIALILSALKKTRWNISHSARLLALPRPTLIHKMRRYGLDATTKASVLSAIPH